MEISHFLPDVFQAKNLILAALTIVGFATVGAALAGRDRDPLFDVFAGFGIVTGLMTILGAVGKVPFTSMAVVFWISVPVCAFVIWWRDRHNPSLYPALGLWARVLVLALPILLPLSAMQASQWDEFSQWLFNALFIFQHDAFPQTGLPQSPSVFPAYPHGNQLFGYLVSRASGSFVEMAVAFGNVLLLLSLAPVYVAMVRYGVGERMQLSNGWLAAAIGILGVTILSATFVQKLVFTAYSDTSTAVLMAVLGVLLWRLVNDLAGDAGKHLTISLQFAFACMLFINIKQTNLVLLVFLLGATFLVVLREREIRLRRFLACLPAMLILPATVYLAWRFHVTEHLPGKEFSLLPMEDWRTEHAFTILARMLTIAANKGSYFGMMFAIAIAGVWWFISGRGGQYGRLLFITGTVFLGYFIFLWAMYIAAFGDFEGMRAASFWRYNTQLGLLGALTAAVALGMFYTKLIAPRLDNKPKVARVLSGLIILAVVATPIALNHKIRFDLRPQKEHMRMVGKELAQSLPAGAVVAVLDPKGQGLADLIIKYEVQGFSTVDPEPRVLHRIVSGQPSWADISERLDKANVSHIWIHQTADGYAEGLGLSELRSDGSTLVVRGLSGDWRLEKFWPYDGYEDPYSLPD